MLSPMQNEHFRSRQTSHTQHRSKQLPHMLEIYHERIDTH